MKTIKTTLNQNFIIQSTKLLHSCMLLTLFSIFFSPGAVQGQTWYNTNWLYRKAITIDYTKVGTGLHANFPVLISITDPDLQARAMTNHNDILFTASDGTTKLFHEVENYTSGTGELVAWVQVPSLSSAANTVIYMYYGNSGATAQQSITSTWNANFKGVYHLNNAYSDATNTFNGANTHATNVAGKIANGSGFNPTNGDGADYITIPGLMGSPSDITLSAWANLITVDPLAADIISIGDYAVLRYDASLVKTAGVCQVGASTWQTTPSATSYTTGWHYVVYTFDNTGNSQQVYVDGQPNGTATGQTASPYYFGGGTNTFIGKHGNGNVNMDFHGTIDEVRISHSVRSAGWILTEYENQNSPSTFYSMGNEEHLKIFTGTGNFSTAARWTSSILPVAGDYLIIDGACTVDNNVTTNNTVYGTLIIGHTAAHTLNWAANGTNQLDVDKVSSSFAASILDMTNGGTLVIRGAWTSTDLSFVPGAGKIELQSTETLPAAYPTYHHLAINNPSITVTAGVNTTVNGNLTVSGGTLNANNFNLTVGGNMTNNGTFTPGTASVNFNGTTILSGNPTTFHHLLISGTLTTALDITLSGNFINNGSFVNSGQLITLSGNTAQQIGGSSLTTFKNLTLNNSAGSHLSANEHITGELKITSGTFSTTGYNFTLISDINGTAHIAPILGNFSGNITMQRYLPAGPSSWRFLASPVSGVTISDWQDNFITSGFPGSHYPNFNFISIYKYDETIGGTSDNGYYGATGATDVITPGKGYWCYIDGTVPLTVDLTGPPVAFNHTFQVSHTPSAGTSEDGYVMIGNPYPSTIDWSSGSWTKNNINNAVYIWNPALQQYASWVSGIGTNGGSNLIASSQAFWVQTNGSSPALACNENVKSSSDHTFLRPLNPAFSNKLKLNIKGNNYKDETYLLFNSTATNYYDNDMDARKLFSSTPGVPGIASQDSTLKDMSINSLPLIDSLVHIPVKTLVNATGNYTIDIDSSSNMQTDFCIVLEDLVTGLKTNLNSSLSYSFDISDTTMAARFILHISASHKTKSISASCNNYQDGKAIVVGKGQGPWNYLWFNNTNNNIKQTLNTFLADTISNLTAGDYSVQISNVSGVCGLYTKKITIVEPIPVNAGFSCVNNTIFEGNADSLVLQNSSSGAILYTWDFGDGSVLDSSYVPSAHHYAINGHYMITLVARFNTCSDTISKKIAVLPLNTADLYENASGTEITIYPNPSDGLFYIKLDYQKNASAQMKVFTISGSNVYATDLVSEKTEINLKHCTKGIYFYSIICDDNTISRGKLLVE